MLWMIALGLVALFVGGLLIFSPDSLVRMNQEMNRIVTRIDEGVLKYRIGVGVSLLIAAAFLFLYAYMMGKI